MSAAPEAREPGPAPEAVTRIALRPIANPLPLGFLALAGATLLLSGLQLGWVELPESQTVGLIIVAF
ncbi:MAG: hypothetical protein QOD65_387, partial [Gaiellales bacterium]|nr:hypothetical protein [Gaiellales bacterium]